MGEFLSLEETMKRIIANYGAKSFHKFIKKVGTLATWVKTEHWGKHNLNVSCLVFALAEAYGLHYAECDRYGIAVYPHDLGKLVPWLKWLFAPDKGKYTPDEKKQSKQHTQAGVEFFAVLMQELEEEGRERARALVKQLIDPQTIVLITDCQLYHDEPYTNGGKSIPLIGRMCVIADAYDTMVTKNGQPGRKYRKRKTYQQAREELQRCAGTEFDPDLVKLFLEKVLVRPRCAKGKGTRRPFVLTSGHRNLQKTPLQIH